MASYTLDKKLELLTAYDFSKWDIPYMYSFIMPILFGLFYTFLYPQISKFFYKYTLNRIKELKKFKQDIEEITPMLENEAKALKKENYQKTEKILELEDKITSIRSEYDMKITTIEDDITNKITTELNAKYKVKIKELKQKYGQEYQEKEKFLEATYQDTYEAIVEERDTLSQVLEKSQTKNIKLMKENKELLEKIPKVLTDNETDEDKILRFFYEENYKTSRESTALDAIVHLTKIPRPKVQQIIKNLIDMDMLSIDRSKRGPNLLEITDHGNRQLVRLFDIESNKS